MAYYMLWVAVLLVWAASLYSLFRQVKEAAKVLPSQKQFQQSHTEMRVMQTGTAMMYFCVFMTVFSVVMAVLDDSWSIRLCFLGCTFLFASYALKNYMLGRILFTRDSFMWKNYNRTFRSITGFQDLSASATEITFTKDSPLVMPVNAAIQIRMLKNRQPGSRLESPAQK